MEKEKWLEAWQIGRTAFHQSAYNKAMVNHFKGQKLKDKNVFIPLAGKSLDILFFLEKEANVIACEISPIAVEEFFKQSKLEFTTEVFKNFTIYKAKNLTFYLGDFFELTKTQVSHVDVMYDRASVVALPKELRSKYYEKIDQLIHKKTHLLILTYTHDGPMEFGPPFYVPEEEIKKAYANMGHDLQMRAGNPEKTDGRFLEQGITTLKNLKWHNNI